MEFYLLVGNDRRGPLSLQELYAQGVRPDSLVWHAGLGNWTPANQVPELRDALFSSYAAAAPTPYSPPQWSDQAIETRTHSKLGIVSFFMGIVIGIGEFALVVIAGIMSVTEPGGVDANAPQMIILGLFLIAGMLAALAGVVLAIVGLVERNRYRVFPMLGLAVNGLIVLGVIGLMVVGSLAS